MSFFPCVVVYLVLFVLKETFILRVPPYSTFKIRSSIYEPIDSETKAGNLISN